MGSLSTQWTKRNGNGVGENSERGIGKEVEDFIKSWSFYQEEVGREGSCKEDAAGPALSRFSTSCFPRGSVKKQCTPSLIVLTHT